MKEWVQKRFLLISVLLYTACFLATRLTYFLHYDIPGFCRDTFGYYYPAIALLKGALPDFDLRTPAYPLFLYACELLKLSTFQIFITQSLLSFSAFIFCQYQINRHLRFLNLPFLLTSLIFLSSGKGLFYDTYINPTGLFAWAVLMLTVMLLVALASNRSFHYFSLSLLCIAAVLLRPQAFFLVPIIGAVCVYNFLKKNHRQNFALMIPLAAAMILFLGYNRMTFGAFTFSKFQALPNIGSAIFFLDDADDYSDETKTIIDSVNNSFTPQEREAIRSSYSLSELSEIFTVDNYNKFFLFWEVYQSNPEELKRLASKSRTRNLGLYSKFVVVNFINYFKVTGIDFFFYYTELNRRKTAIETGDHFTFFKDSEDTFRLIFHEYADQILQKQKLTKTGILTSQDYIGNLGGENFWIKLNHYGQIVLNGVMHNYAWVALCWLAFAASSLHFLVKGYDRDLFLIQLFFIMVLMNYLLLSLTVPPLARYIFPTEFFLYLYPVSVAFWGVDHFFSINHTAQAG